MPELKVTPQHLQRDAYLYIRQSTPRQVLENIESTQRQYALRDRALALGWPLERIHVLDSDLGKSGSKAVDRNGFQKLVSEVALGKADYSARRWGFARPLVTAGVAGCSAWARPRGFSWPLAKQT